jgi:alpha-1,6-mannosyltransferase
VRLHHASAFAIGRGLAMAVGSVLVVVLLWRGTAQPDRPRAMRCVGGALLVVALSGPVVYGWYLGWGLFAAAVGSRPRHRDALVALSAVSCAIGLPAMQKVPMTGQIAVWLAVAALGWWARPATVRNQRVFVPGEARAA